MNKLIAATVIALLPLGAAGAFQVITPGQMQDAGMGFTPFRQCHQARQQAMEVAIGPLRERVRAALAERQGEAARLAALMSTLDRAAKPVITRVQGAAYGGATGLACASDITRATPLTIPTTRRAIPTLQVSGMSGAMAPSD